MKLTKLSLVAALAVSTAFAGGDIAPVEPAPMVETSPWTIGGDAKLYYDTTTTDRAGAPSLFDQFASAGQGAASVDVSYAFADTWKVNAGVTSLFTLGLDDSVVSGVWLYAGANAAKGTLPFTSIGDALWVDTLNVTGTMMDGALTVVVGRQELDTPLAFSEQWTIAPNTFDAAVAIVKPMDELTLVAGYVYDGNGNGGRISTFDSNPGGFTGNDGYFPLAGVEKGAVAVAAIATLGPVTGQAWYYDVLDIAQATWFQADADFSGFTIGGQYSWITGDDYLVGAATAAHALAGFDDSSAFAGKIGYTMDAFNVWAAYSSVDDDGVITISNTATMLSGAGWGGGNGSGQSKLYTEAWWNYGLVGQPGADTFAAGASYNVGDLAMFNGVTLTGQYTSIKSAQNTLLYALGRDATGFAFSTLDTTDLDEVTLLVGTNVYGLDVQLAYIWADATITSLDTNTNTTTSGSYQSDTIQAYLTYKF